MAQYSRHIRKGMEILDNDRSDSVFAYDRTNHKLVVVILNKDNPQNITLDLSRFSRIDVGSVKRWTTHTANGSHYVFDNILQIKSKSLTIPLTQKSIQTIEINNVFI